jgi:hypothetical protein
MEMSRENSLCSYLKQRCHFFSFTKLENRREDQVLLGAGAGTSEKGRRWERLYDGEHGTNTEYTCMKMEK